MAIVYSVTLAQVMDLVTEPAPEGENYSLEATFSDPKEDGAPASAPFGDGAFILVKIGATQPEDTYQNICTYADVIRYGTDRAAAVVATELYYRITTWTKNYASAEDVEGAATLQQQRTQSLCDDFATYDQGPYPDTIYDQEISSA